VLAGDSWWQIAVAVLLAVAFAQLGFLGHDAGHRQIFGTRRSNYALGVACGNLAIGLSYGWWVSKHNRHHAHPNTEGEDPDIMIGVLAFSGGRARAAAGLRRMIFRYQAYLLIPMLLLEGVSLHGSSIRARAALRRVQPARFLRPGAALPQPGWPSDPVADQRSSNGGSSVRLVITASGSASG
jgi:fatty acid desaturase